MMEAVPVTNCDCCGVCCEEMGLPPGYLIPHLLDIPVELREEIAFHQAEEERTGRTRQERGLPCIWLESASGRCKQYAFRPNACRKVMPGDESCLFWRERRAWRLGKRKPKNQDCSAGHETRTRSFDHHMKDDEMAVSREDIDRMYSRLKREAESGGYHLNPDAEFTKELIEGLITNEERYGYPSCPCRLAEGEKIEDVDIICPCDYRDPDLSDHDACYCALYVSRLVLAGEVKLSSIPERRPPREERKQFQAPNPTGSPASLPYPVWRCKVCGYLCAREEPPEVCPVCKAKKDRFERFM